MPALLVLWCLTASEPLTLALRAQSSGLPADELAYWQALLANRLRQQGVQVQDEPPADVMLETAFTRVAASGVRIDLRAVSETSGSLAAVNDVAQHRGEVPELLARLAQELSGELFRRLDRVPSPQRSVPLPAEPAARAERPGLPAGVPLGLVISVLGAGGVAAGVGLQIQARGQLAEVSRGKPESYLAAQQQAAQAKAQATLSAVAMGAGAGLLLVGVLYTLYSARVNTFLAVAGWLSPLGSGLALSAVLP